MLRPTFALALALMAQLARLARSALLALLALAAPAGCGPVGQPPEADAAQSGPTALPADPSGDPAPLDDALAGSWWVFSPEFPNRAFRVELESGDEGQPRAGMWVSFDWRATSEPETLQRRSKPVRIEALPTGDRLTLLGPAPMLMESGQPNGHSGAWRIELRHSGPSGATPHWTGTAVHDGTLTGPAGVPVEMVGEFRKYP